MLKQSCFHQANRSVHFALIQYNSKNGLRITFNEYFNNFYDLKIICNSYITILNDQISQMNCNALSRQI